MTKSISIPAKLLALLVAMSLILPVAGLAPAQIAWAAGQDVAKNAATNKSYADLQDALDEASPEDELTLLKDIEIDHIIKVEKPLNIDMAEKKITFNIPKNGYEADTDLISFSGKGKAFCETEKLPQMWLIRSCLQAPSLI